jgi:hypothetical protein
MWSRWPMVRRLRKCKFSVDWYLGAPQ